MDSKPQKKSLKIIYCDGHPKVTIYENHRLIKNRYL